MAPRPDDDSPDGDDNGSATTTNNSQEGEGGHNTSTQSSASASASQSSNTHDGGGPGEAATTVSIVVATTTASPVVIQSSPAQPTALPQTTQQSVAAQSLSTPSSSTPTSASASQTPISPATSARPTSSAGVSGAGVAGISSSHSTSRPASTTSKSTTSTQPTAASVLHSAHSSGLSSGAKVGIGVGLGVVLSLLLALLVLMLLLRRRKKEGRRLSAAKWYRHSVERLEEYLARPQISHPLPPPPPPPFTSVPPRAVPAVTRQPRVFEKAVVIQENEVPGIPELDGRPVLRYEMPTTANVHEFAANSENRISRTVTPGQEMRSIEQALKGGGAFVGCIAASGPSDEDLLISAGLQRMDTVAGLNRVSTIAHGRGSGHRTALRVVNDGPSRSDTVATQASRVSRVSTAYSFDAESPISPMSVIGGRRASERRSRGHRHGHSF